MTSDLAKCNTNKPNVLNLLLCSWMIPYLTATLGSCVTPQAMMALVPLITLWSCGGVVILVRAADTKRRQKAREREMRKVTEEKTAYKSFSLRRTTLRKIKHDKQISENSFQLKWHAAVCISLLDDFLQKTPRWWLQTCPEECFCSRRNWARLDYYMARPRFPTSAGLLGH